MKKFLLCILLFLSFSSFYGQCPDRYISLNTQADLDNFKTTYPNCTEILKDLSISGSDITNLSALNEITKINGMLSLKNTSLVNLNSLNNLETIGTLFLERNENLQNLTGLEGLTSIKNIDIKYNYALTSLDGLSNITKIDEDLTLTNSSALIDISGLSGLIEVGGNFSIGGVSVATFAAFNQLQLVNGNLSITSISALTQLSNFTSLHTVGGVLTVKNHPYLNSISGFPVLAQIGGFNLDNNDSLHTISGFSALQTINGDFNLGRYSRYSNRDGNDVLVDISGFNALLIVTGNMLVHGNIILSNLTGLENLSTVQGDLGIYYNDNLLNLDGLDGLQTIGGKLLIYDNNKLVELDGLSELKNVNGDVIIAASDALQSLAGLNELINVGGNFQIGWYRNNTGDANHALVDAEFQQLKTVGGDLRFSSNALIPNIIGFNNLESVGGLIQISGSPEAQNISGFNKLTTIGSSISISGLKKLKTISGFQQLQHIPTYFSICTGEELTTITGFAQLKSVGTNFTICSGPLLSNLSGFQNLETIQENFSISTNNYDTNNLVYGDFTNFEGFIKLRHIGGDFKIARQISLENFEGLNLLETIGGDFIVESGLLSADRTFYYSSLTSMSGLNALTSVGGNMTIQNNSSLQNLNGLQSLLSVNRIFTIAKNENLQNLTGLNSLETVNYNFRIRDNKKLEDITGLESLKTVTNEIEIALNPKLETLEGLDNLGTFKKLKIDRNTTLLNLSHLTSLMLIPEENPTITINGNSKLNSLEGLEAVTNLSHLYIGDNSELVSINGLQNLTSVNYLHFERNPKLIDLSAIENLEIEADGLLRIYYNALLQVCNVKSICNFLKNSDRFGIRSNGTGEPGCETKWEILDRCPNPEDLDGDGVLNSIEDTDGTDMNDGCSYLEVNQDINLISVLWEEADCDNDGILNGTELTNGSNPRNQDSDGDGVLDNDDSNPIDACIPYQNSDYVGYDSTSTVWQGYDCDGDQVLNGDELTAGTNPYYNEPFHADSEIPDSWAEQRIDFLGHSIRSIAIDGNTVAVGRFGSPSGIVNLYEKNTEGIWEEVQTLVPDSPHIRFGTAVAISGNTLFVGQPYKSESTPDTVIIYEKGNDGVWVEVQQIQSSYNFEYDGFGSALSISENTLVVGANGIAPSGAVLIFEKMGGTWTETGELTAVYDYFNGAFGSAVAISKNQIVVGSPSTADGGAFIFERQNNGTWIEKQRFTSPSGHNRGYGGAVSIAGNRIIVGDLSYGDLEYGQGQTFVYEKNYDNTWSQVQALTASDGYEGDYFGDALAMNNNRIVVNMSVDQADTGWLYVFHKSGGSWTETHILTDPESYTVDFGYNVAVQGNLIVATSVDYVHFFEPATGDSDGDGIDDSIDSAVLDPCLPIQSSDYADYDSNNSIWASADCDGDGLLNGDEVANGTNPYESNSASITCVEIVSSDGETSDFFGKAMAISNDEQTLAVSSYNDDDLGENSGSVYIFNKSAQGAWEEGQKLKASDGSEDELFGLSMTFAGESLAITAYKQNNRTGAVYVFDKSPTGIWEESQKLLPSDTALYQQFGYAISGIENRLIVGSPNDTENGANSGAAYIFKKESNGEWVETKKLVASDGESFDNFGIAVSIATNTAVVSAWYDDDIIENSGAIYVFENTANENWTEVSKLKASNPGTYSGYGTSIAIANQTIVVGAASINPSDTSVGAAYVYERSLDGSWSQTTQLSLTDGVAKDRFGLHVAVNENRIVCGISGDDDNGPSTGSLQIFEKSNNGIWNPTQKLLACDTGNEYANFGNGVALSNNLVVVGTNLFSAVGSAFVFEISETPSSEIELTVSTTDISCNGTNDGTVNAEATGGTLPYLFILENPALGNTSGNRTGQFSNLRAGDYIVTVRDDLGVEVSQPITIAEAAALNLTTNVVQPCEDVSNGSLNIEASGGIPPYQYSIDNGVTFENTASFINLPAAEYVTVIKDAKGCTFTQLIAATVDENCSNFTLPVNNFTIETTGESCASSNNGSILLRAEENLDYTATLSGIAINESNGFRTFTNFQNLEAGSYELCITVAGEEDYEKCFTLNISEPEALDVDSSLDASGKSVSLNLKGSTKYFIELNGTEYSTSESQITIPLSKIENNITVKTDKECQGVYENTVMAIYNSVSIYPNPVEKGDLTIELPNDNAEEVLLTVFSENGIRVLEKMEKPENRTVQINMDGLTSGVYTIIITTESQNSMRKIIKK